VLAELAESGSGIVARAGTRTRLEWAVTALEAFSLG
jgi:hypothetical protein